MSIEDFRALPTTVLLLIAAACAFAACSKTTTAQRTILEREGGIKGLTRETLTIEVARGDLLQVSLRQSGLDLYVELSLDGRELGRFDSATGRYGEDRAQFVSPEPGSLEITIGSVRFPGVTGSYHLVVNSGATVDEAETRFTQASRVDEPLVSAERIQMFDDAAKRFAGLGRVREEGLAAFGALNLLNDTASDSRLATVLGERAVAALRKADDGLLLASAVNALAAARGEAKQPELMKEGFAEARRLFTAAGSRAGVAEGRLWEAVLNYNEDIHAALATFREVARECADLQELVCQAMALMDVGVALRNTGDYAGAFDSYYQGLALVDADADSGTFAILSDNLAFTLRMLGDFDGAIYHHERALAAFARFGECSGASRSLYGLGYSLLGIGETQQAMRFYKLAIERRCAMADLNVARSQTAALSLTPGALCDQAAHSIDLDEEDRAVAAWITWDLGNFARSLPDPAMALACHDVAATLAISPNHKLGTRLDGVRDLIELGRVPDAQSVDAELETGLRTAHPWYRAQAAEIDAQLLAASGRKSEALSRYAGAAAEYRDVGNFEGMFSALSRRASLAWAMRDARAGQFFADADAALENVRLLSLDPTFSASLFASGRRIYEEWIASVLTEQDGVLKALAISERSRGRLLSQVAKASQVGEEARQARLRSVAAGTLALLESAEAGGTRVAVVTTEKREDPAVRLNRALGLEQARFDRKSAGAAMARLEAYRRSLDKDTTIVEYMLGERTSHAWVLRRDGIQRVDLGGAQPIRAAVTAVRDALASNGEGDAARKALGDLYDLAWRPLASMIPDGRVEIVPDDVLHEVPFAALWDRERQQYLVKRLTLASLPSIHFAATRPAKTFQAGRAGTALLVGDPVYELRDARQRCTGNAGDVSHEAPSQELRRIPASGREVQAIGAMFHAHATPATVLTGCDATRPRVLDGQLADFRFVHFATHATADRVLPQRSAIYLSGWNTAGETITGALTAADFLDRPLAAELVVLSGCATSGGRQLSGEGSLGLPFSLIAGGSRQVISTLWPVADAASAAAMHMLYDGIISRHEAAAVALRGAQISMIDDDRWSHPRHWAAYSLLGT